MATVETVITLTPAAASKIAQLIAEDGEDAAQSALRIAVTGGGCSGFQYALGFDSEVHEDDMRFEQDGVAVVIDETSAEYLRGAQVDFQDGLNGKGFAIENPNSTGSCGCGQSFTC